MKLLSLVVVLIILTLFCRYFYGTHRAYKINRSRALTVESLNNDRTITEADLLELPDVVQNYLRYVGVVGQKKISQFVIEVDGEMRLAKDKDWAPIKVDQTTFVDQGTRLFYIKMNYKGIPINGLHHYESGEASMVIKILDLIKVADNRGEVMNKAETVTFFNDLCIFAPSTLIDANIIWEEIDELSVKAQYTNEAITVSANLFFNNEGQLTNFMSDDRYSVSSNGGCDNIRWSTPINDYQTFNGYNLASIGEAIWHYEDGDFSYIKLNIKNVDYWY